jgi:phytoene dehydrogenase-like protein
MDMSGKACVIGSGPNGLAAAIVLAQAGLQVEVFEAEPQPGGAARTLELTLPGFHHDFGASVFPLAAGSPFFSPLPLRGCGLEWIQPAAALAHPLDDGTAVLLENDLHEMELALGEDGKSWRRLMGPFVDHWSNLATEVLQPIHFFSPHPLLLARFGVTAFPPATVVANVLFRSERTKALFAGLAAHSFLGLDETLSSSVGVLLGASAHAVGWPIARGGSQMLTNALCTHLAELGGEIRMSTRIESLGTLRGYDLTLCDVTPRQLIRIGGGRLSDEYRRRLGKFRYGPGVFKMDYALTHPIPWRATGCLRAATVHVGGSAEEIAAAEKMVRNEKAADRPFVLVVQPSLFDETRAPAGKHTAWAYSHVPNGCELDMQERIEAQIERFAPGFRDCVLARRVFSPSSIEKMDANLVGGDINGGALELSQFLFRPTRQYYATSAKDVYLCSASTPPGGGVHGMCGYHAAKCALARLRS